MTDRIEFRLPSGYSIDTCTETVSIDTAGDLLKTKRQFKYTKATRNDETMTADMVRHIWICPYCGNRIPAYRRNFDISQSTRKMRSDFIDQWSTRQLSLFPKDDQLIELQYPLPKGPEYKCPKCHRMSSHSGKERNATIVDDKDKIILSVELENLGDIFSIKWMPSGNINLSFPLVETVVFNFKRGTTFIKLHDADGGIFSICDITKQPQIWNNGPICEALHKYTILSRTLKRHFEIRFGGKLPYFGKELTPDKYVLMTRFVGYNRSFYDTIPFTEDSNEVDKSFSSIINQLRSADGALKLFESSSLPKSKSIRRIIFNNPGVLFYINECETLWGLIQDVNLFRDLMKHDMFFNIVSQLHLYPGIALYYRDYIKVKSAKSFIKKLTDDFNQTNYEAAAYAVMNSYQQKSEQAKWECDETKHKANYDDDEDYEDDPYITALPDVIHYSTPMGTVDQSIPTCEIDGFRFSWLRTSNEYRSAGEQLNNCLRGWSRSDGPVVAVFQSNKIVAAIEVINKRMVQAYKRNNRIIEDDSNLGRAIKKWQTRYGIKDRYCNCDELPC